MVQLHLSARRIRWSDPHSQLYMIGKSMCSQAKCCTFSFEAACANIPRHRPSRLLSLPPLTVYTIAWWWWGAGFEDDWMMMAIWRWLNLKIRSLIRCHRQKLRKMYGRWKTAHSGTTNSVRKAGLKKRLKFLWKMPNWCCIRQWMSGADNYSRFLSRKSGRGRIWSRRRSGVRLNPQRARCH